MSKLISQLADVLAEIAAEKQRGTGFRQTPELRKGAVSAVAEKYGVTENTIADGFIRRLRPDIDSTEEFDAAVHQWLKGKPDVLRRALLRHIGSGADAKRVFDVLERIPEKPH